MEENKSTGVAKSKSTLPKLEDLHHDIQLAFKNDELNLLLNQLPPKSWVKQHPMVKKEIINAKGIKEKVPSEFIPIDMVELLLTRIFQHWRVEVLREGALFNSVYCTIRLYYLHPITNEWMWHDGVGSVGVQTDAGKSASDLGAIKSAAIQMALPAAKSYAIKDAAEHLGKLFGKDLNRQNAIDFTMAYNNGPKDINEELETPYEELVSEDIPQEAVDAIKAADLTLLKAIWANNKQLQEFPEFQKMIEKRRAELDLEKMQAQHNQQPSESETSTTAKTL